MALDTKITYAAPEVTITVDDDGGGDKNHKVEVCVTWDPHLLKYKNYLEPKKKYKLEKKKGYCLWYSQEVPKDGPFEISLESRGKGDAYVCAAALDKFKGQVKGDVYLIPDKDPSMKAKKKPKKKS